MHPKIRNPVTRKSWSLVPIVADLDIRHACNLLQIWSFRSSNIGGNVSSASAAVCAVTPTTMSSYCFAMTVIVATTCTAWSLPYLNLLRDRGAVICVWLFSTANDPQRRRQRFFFIFNNFFFNFVFPVLLSIVTSMLLNYVLLSVNWYSVSLEINQCHVVSFTFDLFFLGDSMSLKKPFPMVHHSPLKHI